LILALLRKISLQDNNIRKGCFDKKNYAGLELFGKTLGLIGFGRIGRRVCELIAPFKVDVIVYHPSSTNEVLPDYVSKVAKIEDVYSSAGIISLHCPLTSQTRGLIDGNAIAQMKNGVYLINTARGGIVNEGDLIVGLQQGRIGGAALDVFESEPPAADNPLFAMENVLVTPHIAGMSDNSFKNMGIDAVNNILAVLNGNPYEKDSLVNKESVARR
jgi:D-3-phosphoglycerate dehydrogenase